MNGAEILSFLSGSVRGKNRPGHRLIRVQDALNENNEKYCLKNTEIYIFTPHHFFEKFSKPPLNRMVKKLLFTLSIGLGCILSAFGQGGTLKTTVVDASTNEPIPFAVVSVESKGAVVSASPADIDGISQIKPIAPGTYNVKVTYTGYKAVLINNVTIFEGKTQYVNARLTPSVIDLGPIEVVAFKEPLIDPDTKSGGNVTREEYQRMATKNVNSVAAQTAGVVQTDEGGDLNIRGGRSDGSETFIDGQRVIGTSGLPQQSIEQVSVITGGVPASFGDATAGIINITTRGPQSTYFGGVEAISSELTDKFGYNFLGFSVGGPLVFKKDSSGAKKPLLGFIISGEVSTERDPDPSAVGMWKVKDDVLENLEKNPLRSAPLGQGTLRNAEFITKEDLEPIAAKQNIRSNFGRINAKFDYKPTDNLNITVGGSIDYNNRRDFQYVYALFNPSNNPQSIDNTWRVYARLQQKLGVQGKEAETSSSNIKNAYYSIQANYTRVNNLQQDDSHRNNFFNYGYLGKYKTHKTRTYSIGNDSISGLRNVWIHDGFRDTLVSFTPDTLINPEGAAFTSQYYRLKAGEPFGNYENLFQIQANGGLLNGDRPGNVYALWFNTGRQFNGYVLEDQRQFRITSAFNADIKDHSIQIGFEYEQRNESNYSINPIELWTLMRQITNDHIQDLDKSNPTIISSGVIDTVNYDRLYVANKERQFSKSLRERYGFGKTEWVDTDNMSPDMFSLDMFSADDLLNNGNSYVNYWGYDYLGNKLTKNPTFEEFFTAKDANGNYTRPIAAFQPIYIAGYIQDKFDFRDLKFNVGLRVDRFDANQKVLKDKYVLYDTYKAGEVTEVGNKDVTHPSNIGDDYVVYVNDVKNPTAILGYRDGDRWYNAQGGELNDPSVLAAGGSISPFLKDPEVNMRDSARYDPNTSFKDYTPQINIMPRVAFSFPISEMANFFAHYDVLTQRPPERLRMDLLSYYYLDLNGGRSILGSSVINNPDLKPEKTVDYELGFSQVLNEQKNSAITLSAFYRELRNMIQVQRVNQAYPTSYTSFSNIDFGTVSGFSVGYDLRRTGNVSINANYTLSFANGTGSNATSAFNIISNSNQPNLRTTIPLDFDQRHNFVTNVDYRFASGSEYNGPKLFGKNILENFGANVTARGSSGTPYSRQGNITQEGAEGIAQISTLKGNLNGSRLPFQFRIDLRLEKSFPVTFGKNKDGEQRKGNLNIYLQMLNVLNARNVISVYRATGNPGDDGYLTAPSSQSSITTEVNPQSFIDLYGIKINDPNNYSIPRRTRIGVMLDF